MTIKQAYPTQRPALDLNFARQKRLDPRVTFTRGSTATYVGSDGLIKTAADDEARFDYDPVTGESLGLLIEESRTNNCLYSEALTQTGWSTNNGTLSLSAFAAPDSTVSMYGFTATSADADVRYNIPTSIIGEITFSFFLSTQTTVRYVAAYNYRYNAQSAVAVFDLQEETATSDYDSGVTTGSTVATIRRLGNNFYRCSLTYEQVSASTPIFGIGPTTQTSLIAYYLDDPRTFNGGLGDLTGESVYVWGAQIEYNASFPTSYIPTSGSTVTRAADVVSITGTNFSDWYNGNEGTFVAHFDADGRTGAGRIIGSNAGQTPMYLATDAIVQSFGNVVGASVTVSSVLDVRKAGITYESSAQQDALAVDGGTPNTSTNSGNFAGYGAAITTSIQLFSYPSAPSYTTGHISRLAYYPTRLPDTQLQTLTL